MNTLPASIKKEAILLFRDFPGLLILFLMPVLLMFVVTVAQVTVIKNEINGTQVLWVDEMKDAFSAALFQNIDSSGYFKTVTSVDNTPVDATTASTLVEKGKYQFGIILSDSGKHLRLLVDPAVQERQRTAVTNSLKFLIKTTRANLKVREMLTGVPEQFRPVVFRMLEEPVKDHPEMTEIVTGPEQQAIQPTMLQNILPGFILFSMFFIVIPLSGSMISEKTGGTFVRLKSFPTGLTPLIAGKVVIFLLVCLLQFMLMLILGTKFFPAWFGYPSLEIGRAHV